MNGGESYNVYPGTTQDRKSGFKVIIFMEDVN